MKEAYGLTYDREQDVLLLALPQPRGPTTDTVRRGRDVSIDFDELGAVCMVEVMNASKYYPKTWLRSIGEFAGPMLTLEEAATEAKLSPITLRVQIRNGRIPQAVKRGADWAIPRAALHNYLESRQQGRRTDVEAAAKKRTRKRAPASR